MGVTNQAVLESFTRSCMVIKKRCHNLIQPLYTKLVYISMLQFLTLKNYFLKTGSICFLYVIMFIEDLQQDLEKIVRKLVWWLKLLAKTFTIVLRSINMFIEKALQLIFLEARLTLEFLIYETAILTFELSYNHRLEKKSYEVIMRRAIDIL